MNQNDTKSNGNVPLSSTELLADCERQLEDAEKHYSWVTLSEACASLQQMDSAWDDMESARAEYEAALSANLKITDDTGK